MSRPEHIADADKAFERFAKQWGLSDNPMQEVRDPEIPVGLKVHKGILSAYPLKNSLY